MKGKELRKRTIVKTISVVPYSWDANNLCILSAPFLHVGPDCEAELNELSGKSALHQDNLLSNRLERVLHTPVLAMELAL
jgi:hypothetical protein